MINKSDRQELEATRVQLMWMLKFMEKNGLSVTEFDGFNLAEEDDFNSGLVSKSPSFYSRLK